MNYRRDNYGLGLTYRILDLYRQEKQKLQIETSIDAPIYGGNNDATTLTLEEVIDGNFIDPMETLIQEDREEFWEKLSAAIQALGCHPRDYPQCTCGEIARRRLLTNPPQKWKEIADEFKVPFGTITAHWHIICIPHLTQIYNQLLGGE